MNGKVTMVDIMITGPATSCKVNTHETHLYPGRAAQLGFTVKKSKWRNAGIEETEFKLLPFVIETGGRIHKAACQWLDAIAKGGDMGTCLAVKQVYKTIARQLNFMQADMLHQYHRRDRPITRNLSMWFALDTATSRTFRVTFSMNMHSHVHRFISIFSKRTFANNFYVWTPFLLFCFYFWYSTFTFNFG